MGMLLKVLTGKYVFRSKRDRRMADSRRLSKAQAAFGNRRVFRRVSTERRNDWRRISRWSSSAITSGLMDSLSFNFFPRK